jgi:antitoxin VapB
MNIKPKLSETRTAKLFMNGRSQAVRLPAEFRFEGTEVNIRRNPETGEVILSPKRKRLAPTGNWDKFLESRAKLRPEDIPEGFPWRDRRSHDRDPFA